jgi:pimeloyl-ACP methyl ester carboxylesterase
VNVTSKDGTAIAVFRTGSGPPLILSTGSLSDHRRWTPVLPWLEKHLTVYTYDRRGRGGSGDTEPYSIEREFEDIVAIADHIDGPVNLLGHSYGAIVALGASLQVGNLHKLILYEPPLHVRTDPARSGIPDDIQALTDAGDREGAVMKFYVDVQRRAPEELDRFRESPLWEMFLDVVHTLPREMRNVYSYRFERERFHHLKAPTLLLLGSKSPPTFKEAVDTLHDALPDSRIHIMPDQGHAAMDTGTELFASEIINFLTG